MPLETPWLLKHGSLRLDYYKRALVIGDLDAIMGLINHRRV
ncbi:MAG: hypothetical protein ACJAYF_004098 [Arenicella sp.]|jgi:hypothetical protein